MRLMTSQRLSHKERIQLLLAGERIERTPASFWRHFYHKKRTAEGLAESMLHFQEKFDWDFMKVNPRASYHAQPWGAVVEYSRNELVKTKIIDYPIKAIQDWKRVEPKRVSSPALAEQLQALTLIGKKLKGNLFFLETVFTPLSVAGYLVPEKEWLVKHLRENPDLIHQALEAITQTFEKFVEEVLNTGASGIFLATTHWATSNSITKEDYLQFGKPYDLRILNRVKDAELNVLHVCESNNFLESFKDYPVSVVNWDAADPTNLTPEQGHDFLNKTVLGGVNHQKELLDPDPTQVTEQAIQQRSKMEERRWMLGPGCSIPPETPPSNLARLRNLVEEWRI